MTLFTQYTTTKIAKPALSEHYDSPGLDLCICLSVPIHCVSWL